MCIASPAPVSFCRRKTSGLNKGLIVAFVIQARDSIYA